MQRSQEPFGKRRVPVAEFKSLEEEFRKGEIAKRTERVWTVNVTPVLAITLMAILVLLPESRAVALEIGAKAIEIGRDWLLRGRLE